MRIILALVLSLLLLTGCATTSLPATRVVVQETMTMVDVDQQYLKDCTVSAPIEPMAYSGMGVDEREDALSRLTINLYRDLQSCNLDKKSIREQITKKQTLVDDFNQRQKQLAEDAKKGP